MISYAFIIILVVVVVVRAAEINEKSRD